MSWPREKLDAMTIAPAVKNKSATSKQNFRPHLSVNMPKMAAPKIEPRVVTQCATVSERNRESGGLENQGSLETPERGVILQLYCNARLHTYGWIYSVIQLANRAGPQSAWLTLALFALVLRPLRLVWLPRTPSS